MNESIFYTDMTIIHLKNRAILVRNDFRLYEIDFEMKDGQLTGIQKNYATMSFANILESLTRDY